MSHDASVVPSRFLPPPGAISMRRSSVVLALFALVAGLVLAAPTATTAAPKAGGSGLGGFVGSLSPPPVDQPGRRRPRPRGRADRAAARRRGPGRGGDERAPRAQAAEPGLRPAGQADRRQEGVDRGGRAGPGGLRGLPPLRRAGRPPH